MDELSRVAVNALVVVLVGQLVASLVFLFGFVPRVKKALDTDIPAQLTEVNGRLAQISQDLSALRDTFAAYRERIGERLANHETRLDGVERDRRGRHERDDLDSTRGGQRG